MEQVQQMRIGDEREMHDEVYRLVTHLHAQTLLICGEGLENFSNHNDEIRSNYLWSICDLAERALHLLSQLRAFESVVKSD